MENNSLAIFDSGNKSNFLNLPYRKNTDYAYNRGYNEALRKCNQRAYNIFKLFVGAYQRATEEEFDDDYNDDY